MAKVKSKQKIKRRRVTFSFESSDAKEVILMGDFNNWNQFCPVRKKQAATACLLWFCLSPLAEVQITPLKNTF